MARAPVFPVEEKVRVVLSILAGEVSVAEAARRGGVQWERKDDDGEIARRVLNLLADLRVLWKDSSAAR